MLGSFSKSQRIKDYLLSAFILERRDYLLGSLDKRTTFQVHFIREGKDYLTRSCNKSLSIKDYPLSTFYHKRKGLLLGRAQDYLLSASILDRREHFLFYNKKGSPARGLQ